MLKVGLLALLCVPSVVLADAYKCIDRAGLISYAAIPCPLDQGDALYQGKTQPGHWVSVNEQDAQPDAINKRALKVLQASYRTRINYQVTYLDGPAPPRAAKPKVKPKPMNCQRGGAVLSCDGHAR